MLQTPEILRESSEDLRLACLNGHIKAKARHMDNVQERRLPKSVFKTAEFEDFEGKVVVLDGERKDNLPHWYEPRFLTADILNTWPSNEPSDGHATSQTLLVPASSKTRGRPRIRREKTGAAFKHEYPQGIPDGVTLKEVTQKLNKLTGLSVSTDTVKRAIEDLENIEKPIS